MRRTLTIGCVFALSAALGCSSPVGIHHGGGGSGGSGGGVGGVGGSGGTGGGAGGGGSGGSGGGNTPDGGNNCGVQNFMLTKSGTPDLLIVQDRSGSMSMDANGGDPMTSGMPSKWDAITMAIEQVVGSVNTVDWGLMFFGPDGGGIFGGGCTVSSTPQVPCGMNTSSAINMAISATKPTTSTPTAEAMTAATQYFQGNMDGNAHYILLATDGQPSCGGNNDVQRAEDAVTAAAKAGIKTIVVGIGNDPTADTTLSTMATNGGMPNMTAGQKPYYQVNTTNDLVMVLNKIAGTIVSCDYALAQAPMNPNLVTIQDNKGMTIPRDPTHMNGWDFGPNNMSIQFYGMACDNLQKGVTTGISAVFGCPPIQ